MQTTSPGGPKGSSRRWFRPGYGPGECNALRRPSKPGAVYSLPRRGSGRGRTLLPALGERGRNRERPGPIELPSQRCGRRRPSLFMSCREEAFSETELPIKPCSRKRAKAICNDKAPGWGRTRWLGVASLGPGVGCLLEGRRPPPAVPSPRRLAFRWC